MRLGMDDGIDTVEMDVRADQRKRSRYERKLQAHPNCLDPDHPGCMWCSFDEDGEPEDDDE